MLRSLIAVMLAALLAPSASAEKRSIQKKASAAKPNAAAVKSPRAPAPAASKPRSIFDPPPVGNVVPVAPSSGGSGSGAKPTASVGAEAAPPQAGVLIRSEGLVAPAAATPVGRHEVDGGSNFITDDPGKSQLLNPRPGIHYGKADSPPSSGGASGKSGIVANPPAGE
jgi:hypothetical protein